MKRLCTSAYPRPPAPHTSISGKSKEKSPPFTIDTSKEPSAPLTQRFCDQVVPALCSPQPHLPPSPRLPSQGQCRRETQAMSSFLPPAPILLLLRLHFCTLRSMQMCSLTYPKRKRDWAPWDWRQGEVARHLCAFSETEMLVGWDRERVIWGAEGYRGGMVRC